MVCPACGAPFEAEVRFCSRCGTQVTAAQPAPEPPSSAQSGAPFHQTSGQVPPGQAWQTVPPGPGGYAPPIPPQMPNAAPGWIPMAPRVQKHLQTLAVLWIVYGVYRVFAGLIGVFVLRAFTWRRWSGFPFGGGTMIPFGGNWMSSMVPVVVTISLLALTLALFTGWSLLNRKPWGRVLAIVVGVLALFKFPVGTALGIYTLWVLAPRQSGLEYEAMEDRS